MKLNRASILLSVGLAIVFVITAYELGRKSAFRTEATNDTKEARLKSSPEFSKSSAQNTPSFEDQAKELLKEKKSLKRSVDLIVLIKQWVHSDPPGALNFVNTLQNDAARTALGRNAMTEWLSIDNAAAIRWTKLRVSANYSNARAFLGPVLKFVSDNDEEGALSRTRAVLGEFPQVKEVYDEFESIANNYIRSHVDTARSFIDSLSFQPAKQNLYETLGMVEGKCANVDALRTLKVSELSETAAAEASGMIESIYEKNQPETLTWLISQPVTAILDRVRHKLASADLVNGAPESATQLAIGISDRKDQQFLVSEALQFWLAKDFVAAQNWAFDNHITNDELIKLTVKAEKYREPIHTTTFAERMAVTTSLKPSDVQWRSQLVIFGSWVQMDPEAARNWLDTSALPEPSKQKLRDVVH